MSISDGIFCLGVDHHATPLGVREVLASSSGDRWIPHLIEHGGAAEVVFLSTCNRVEIYGRSESRGPAIVSDVARSMPLELGNAWREARGVYLHEGIACWRHLAEVATGLRSMVVGEGEILAQVRQAYAGSRNAGGTGRSMHALFQSGLRAARAARAVAGFGQGDASVGRLAAEALEEMGGGGESRPLLLLGSGLTARSFVSAYRNLSERPLWISSRSAERAGTLAAEFHAHQVEWGNWPRSVADVSVVVSALAGGELPWSETSHGGPDILMDLGVPRTLTALQRSFPGATWVDLEELARRSEIKPESLQAIHRAEEVLRRHESIFAVGRAPSVEGSQVVEG